MKRAVTFINSFIYSLLLLLLSLIKIKFKKKPTHTQKKKYNKKSLKQMI